MTPRARSAVTLCAVAALLAVLLAGFARLPPFGTYLGPYGTLLNAVAPRERKIPNVVTAVNFDYRGLDTMGEEFILFAAVGGLTLVLRKDRRETTGEPLPAAADRPTTVRSDAVRAFAVLGVAVTAAFGIYMALHPQLTPGGGFQGGAITAGFAALLFLGLGYGSLKRCAPPENTAAVEAAGAAGYVVIGIVTLAVSGYFLANVLPLGSYDTFFSTGTIAVINFCVAVEVIAGFVVMFGEFADETRVERAPEASEGGA